MNPLEKNLTSPLVVFGTSNSYYNDYQKTPSLLALFVGTLLGGLFALIFQPQLLMDLSGSSVLNFKTIYISIFNAITVDTQIETNDPF